MINRLLILTLSFWAMVACKKDEVEEKKIWLENIGSRTDLPFLPDGNVNYYMYSFKRQVGDKIGLRISADFPFARYMSYNIYDNRTRASLASLIDVDIKTENGNENPFVTGSQSSSRKYVVHVLPNIVGAENYENALLFDDKIQNLCTMLRLYVPEKDELGGVALPEIQAFDLNTGNPVDLPEPLPIDFFQFRENTSPFENVIGLTFLLQEAGIVDFYRFSGAGLYQNFDNQYLFAPIVLNQKEVAIIKVNPPVSARSLAENASADMRYYSFCIGDAATYNYFTLADFECKIASDGFIYLVIGRDEPDLRSKAEGLNYLVWDEKLKNRGLIIYRNLLAKDDYPFNMKQVPDIVENLDKVFETDILRAHTYLGERAPKGVKMQKEAFLENFGGFEVAY